jgi:NAD(P)-dependent dehydrogenase (short-subunit alcohol dehydrogenase family)
MKTAYIFGASGEIGASIAKKFESQNYEVIRFSRNPKDDGQVSIEDVRTKSVSINAADSVVWASGANLNDSINTYDADNLLSLLKANLFYITDSLDVLLKSNLVNDNAGIVIISSVWQNFSKENKLSYTVSKSAVQGLIHSLTADLASKKIRVNGVLPGVVDTKMSRKALSDSQIKNIEGQTPDGELVTLNNVANVSFFLASVESKGINGQSLTIDGGWSVVRYV